MCTVHDTHMVPFCEQTSQNVISFFKYVKLSLSVILWPQYTVKRPLVCEGLTRNRRMLMRRRQGGSNISQLVRYVALRSGRVKIVVITERLVADWGEELFRARDGGWSSRMDGRRNGEIRAGGHRTVELTTWNHRSRPSWHGKVPINVNTLLIERRRSVVWHRWNILPLFQHLALSPFLVHPQLFLKTLHLGSEIVYQFLILSVFTELFCVFLFGITLEECKEFFFWGITNV